MNHLTLQLRIASSSCARHLEPAYSPKISARRRALLLRRRDDPAP